jgi:hypothetical protein
LSSDATQNPSSRLRPSLGVSSLFGDGPSSPDELELLRDHLQVSGDTAAVKPPVNEDMALS